MRISVDITNKMTSHNQTAYTFCQSIRLDLIGAQLGTQFLSQLCVPIGVKVGGCVAPIHEVLRQINIACRGQRGAIEHDPISLPFISCLWFLPTHHNKANTRATEYEHLAHARHFSHFLKMAVCRIVSLWVWKDCSLNDHPFVVSGL